MAKASMKSALRTSLKRESVDFEEKCRRASSILNVSSNENKEQEAEKSGTRDEVLQENPTVVRFSISVTETDTNHILQLRQRLFRMGIDASRSRILRASIAHLLSAPDGKLKAILEKMRSPRRRRENQG